VLMLSRQVQTQDHSRRGACCCVYVCVSRIECVSVGVHLEVGQRASTARMCLA
jgi:hypothetical protein